MERRLEHGAVPDLWLLRKKPSDYSVLPVTYVPVRVWTDAPPHQPEWDGTVDLAACEVIMRDDGRCRQETYQAALLRDAMRFAAPGLDTPYSLYYQNGLGKRVVCPRTIPPLQSRIMDLVFLQAINTVKDPVTKLLNKAVNQRCMIRKFGKVALDVFKTSDEAVVTLRLLLLTSLLGNYEHARPSSRPDSAVRAWLYKTFEGFQPDVWQTSFHLRLYTVSPHLMLFVLREYLVYALDDDPALRAHYNTFANFDKFKTTVVQCMDEVRVWFAQNIRNERSSFHASLWHSNRPPEVQYIFKKPDWDEAQFFSVLNDTILIKHHEALLKLSYKRPKDTIVTLLHGMRTAIPMVQRPGYAVTDSDDPDDMEEEPVSAQRDSDAVTTLDLRPFVPPKQLEALNKIADGAMVTFKNTALALVRSLDALECCGVSSESTQHVKRLIRDMQSGVMNTKQYTQQLKALQKSEPHAYNLVQALVELFREKQRVRVLCTLPVRYMRNQLKALKERYGLKLNEPYVLKETIHFVYCPVCDSVYSLLRDFSSSYINNYGYGLRDAVVSYTSDKLYCKRSKVNHRGRCADQELAFIPLLGKMLHFQGKNIIMCPQPNCGMPMVLDSKRCVWTEHGPSCYDCTFRHNMARLEYQVDFMTRCALCFVDITRSETLFLYPHGVTLCQKHHRRYPQLQVELQTPENIIRCVDRTNTIKVIYNYHKMRKAERMRANQGYIAWALKRSRMQTRSRKK